MADPSTVAETWSIAQLATGGSVGAILLAVVNSILNRKNRGAQVDQSTAVTANTLAEGSVNWAAQILEQYNQVMSKYDALDRKYDDLDHKYDDLEDKYDALNRRFSRQQDANARHTVWDEALMEKLREAGIDFPDPPSLEVA